MSRLTCTQVEAMLLDAADGVLLPDELSHFQLHLSDCESCTLLFADVRRGSAWLDVLREAPPEPPADLVQRILAKTSGEQAASSEFLAQAAHAASLFGDSRARVLPFRVPAHLQQPRTRMQRLIYTVTQPRFAMTAAMAFFSLALTLNLAGLRITSLRIGDLKPASVKKRYWAANSRVVQYYDNLRVVYELESRVHEMQRESDDPAPRRGVLAAPLKEDPQRESPTGTPHSSVPLPRRRVAAEHALQPLQRVALTASAPNLDSRSTGEPV